MKDPLGIKINSIPVLYKLFPNEEACINYLVTFNQNGTPISLFDKTSKVYKLKNGNYRCKNTEKNFTVKIGTIFEKTLIPQHFDLN